MHEGKTPYNPLCAGQWEGRGEIGVIRIAVHKDRLGVAPAVDQIRIN